MKSRCCNLCRKSFCHNITEGLCVSSWALCDNCEKEVRRAIFLKDRNKDGIGEHSYFEDDDKNRDDYDVFLFGIDPKVLRDRICRGWSTEKALKTPIRKRKRKSKRKNNG